MSTADAFPPLPAVRPIVSVSEPVADGNGYVFADDTLSVGTGRRWRDGAPVLFLEATAERPRDEQGGDATPEGFADLMLTLPQARTLAAGLPALVAFLESLPTEPAAR